MSNNPLVNRIYKSNNHGNKSNKSQISSKTLKVRETSIDSKILVPKLGSKTTKLRQSSGAISDKPQLPQPLSQKSSTTMMAKPYFNKLPSLYPAEANKNKQFVAYQTEKKIELPLGRVGTSNCQVNSNNKMEFRSRKLSSQLRDQFIHKQQQNSKGQQEQYSMYFPTEFNGENDTGYNDGDRSVKNQMAQNQNKGCQSQKVIQNQHKKQATKMGLGPSPKMQKSIQQPQPQQKYSSAVITRAVMNYNKTFLKTQQDYAQEKSQQDDQFFEYLQLLQKNTQLKEQFCYMNRYSFPYSFYIVNYEDRNKEEYLTVSLRGVTYSKEGQDDFMSIKQFSRDVTLFRKARRINFFADYLRQKVINHWKIAMVRKKFINQCEYVKDNLLSQNEVQQKYMHFLHNMYMDFCKGNFYSLTISKTIPSVLQFKECMKKRRQQIVASFLYLEKQVYEHLLEANTVCLDTFRKDKRVTIGLNDKFQKEQSFLPYDNRRKAMRYTQLAKLKQFEQRLFRLIKYTDLIRFNLRIQYLESSLQMSIKEMKYLYQKYENRNRQTFTSWLQCQVTILKESPQPVSSGLKKDKKHGVGSHGQSSDNQSKISSFIVSGVQKNTIAMIPDCQQIRSIMIEHKKECIQLLWYDYKNLIEQKDNLLCLNFQNLNGAPNSSELRWFFEKSKTILMKEKQFQISLDKIISQIESHVEKLQQSLLTIYNASFMDHPIEYYLQNTTLKDYLGKYDSQKEQIQSCQECVEFGLVVLKADNFKLEVKRKYEEKYRTIITAVPNQVLNRTQKLSAQVKEVYNEFKDNPSTIRQYIEFEKLFKKQKVKIQYLEEKIEGLLELQSMLQENKIKIVESARIHIIESQTLFRQLQKRFEQIESQEQKVRIKYQTKVANMIPIIQNKSEDLLKKVTQNSTILNPCSKVQQVDQQMQSLFTLFQNLKRQKQELFQYQIELELGHKDLENYFLLQQQLGWFQKLWNGKKDQLAFDKIVKQSGYKKILGIDLQPMRTFLQNLQSASTEIQALDLIREFKAQTKRIIHIIKLTGLVATETFEPQHCEQVRNILTFKVKRIKDLIFTRQGQRTIFCEDLYEQTNIKEVQNQLSYISYLSAQDSIIKKQLSEVEEYWRKNKIRFITEQFIGNGVTTLHLDQNQQLHEKLGLFVLTLKNIENSQYAKGHVLERLKIQIKVTSYIRALLSKWSQVEKEWIKLLPIMTNSPSVKHQSNVYFEFSSVDNIMKKLIKQVSDMSSMRKVVEDYQDKKFMQVLEKCRLQLKIINRVFNQFLETKRSTYNRFYFLTDEELITIIQNVKNARTFSKFGGMCFNCDHISMQSELIDGFKTSHQIFKLRKSMLRGQPDQMFKQVSQNMKSSMKFAVRNLVPKMKIATNIEQELRDNSMQVCIICDLLIWTQMSETYLTAASYDEYQLLIKGPYEQMARLLPKVGKDLWLKLAMRLMQTMFLKQLGEQLIREQVTKDDFKWKQQFKYMFEEDEITIRQFTTRLNHGLQYFPPEKIIVSTLNTERFMYESYYCCLNSKTMIMNGVEGEGKRNMVKHNAGRVGIYYKEIVCNSNLNTQYLMRFVQGACLAGAWISFYQSSNLKTNVVYELLEGIEQRTTDKENKCHAKTLFMLIDHGTQFQKVSMFKFNNFTFVQPNYKRICEYLLQMYRFREWEELTQKIMGYVKIIKPLMQNIMGSSMRLIRKIVDGAGQQKLLGSSGDSQTLMVVKIIQKQIIDKGSEDISTLLSQAMKAYFKVEQSQQENFSNRFTQKSDILKQLIQREDVDNILLVGERSCKSTLIRQAIQQLKLDSRKIFPEATEQFFTPYSSEYFRKLPGDSLVLYDGNNVVSEFSDLITSGYLLIDGRKVTLSQKIVIEIRKIGHCSPSFIQNCQLVYVGNLISKKDRFFKYSKFDEDSLIFDACKSIFGEQLEQLDLQKIEILAKFLNPYQKVSQGLNIHKKITWLLSVLDDDAALWKRNYGGKHSDLIIDPKSMALIPVDPSKFCTSKYLQTNFLYVPTNSTVLVNELSNYLAECGLAVQLYGGDQSGKSSAFKLLRNKKIELSVSKKTIDWAAYLKKKLLTIRKEGRNYLFPVGQQNYKIIIDDIDIGTAYHNEFIRSLIQTKEIRDHKFESYIPEKFEVLICSKNKQHGTKLDNHVAKIKVPELTKDSLSTIFSANTNNLIKVLNINRQVSEYLDGTALKTLLIVYDDLQRLYNSNIACSRLISVLKSVMSLPQKNQYISADDFSSLFKSIFHQKLTERLFTKKLKHQMKDIYENICRITFKKQTEWQYWVNIESIYKQTDSAKLSALITQKHPHLIVYEGMVQSILRVSNQLQSLKPHIMIIGRRGVGKSHIVKISASINKLQIVSNVNEAIMLAIKNKSCVLLEQTKADSSSITLFEELSSCQVDEDLQKFLEIEQRDMFRQVLKGVEISESTEIIVKVQNLVKNVVLVNEKQTYLRLCEKCRLFNDFSICILDQWPIQAITGIYQTQDGNSKIHAQLFLKSNQLLIKDGSHSMPMAFYQKYIKVLSTLIKLKEATLKDRYYNLNKIYNKFNQSCIVIREWNAKVSVLEQQLNQMISVLEKNINFNKLNAFVSAVLTKYLHEQQTKTIEKKKLLQRSKEKMEVELRHTKKIIDKMEKFISSLQRTQMGELKKIYKTNNLVEFGLSCLCVLFKEQATDKSINKILADPNLMMKMKSNDILQTKNQKFVDKLKKDLPKYQGLMKSQTSETPKILIDWMNSIIEYWVVNEGYLMRKLQFKRLSEQFKDTMLNFERISADLKSVHEKTIKMRKQRQQMQQKKHQCEKQLLQLKIKLQNSEQIIPILMQTEEEVHKIVRKLKILVDNITGNCILFAFATAFMPLRRLNLKHRMLELAKKHLQQNFISFSDNFISQTVQQRPEQLKGQASQNSLERLNLFLIEKLDIKSAKIIIDPERKAISYLQDIDKRQIADSIIEKVEQLISKNEQLLQDSIYHTIDENIKTHQSLLIIDWKVIALNPHQKLFSKIAYSKRPEYFIAKQELNKKIKKNLFNLENMKIQLYEQICKSELKILDDSKFIDKARELIKMQSQTKMIQEEVQEQVVLIQKLSCEIKQEVDCIFIMLRIFKEIRPINLDLMLDAAQQKGDTIQNVIRWAIANLDPKHREGWLLAFLHTFKGNPNQQLLKNLVLKYPLKLSQVKIKKPALVNLDNWDKILKLSTYSENLKNLTECVQKNQKQFEAWMCDNTPVLPALLLPEQLNFVEHLFLISFLKPRLYSEAIHIIVKENLSEYNLSPLQNKEIVCNSNQRFPIVCHFSVWEFSNLVEQLNADKYSRLRIGSISSETQMKRALWKSMEQGEWLLIYGFTTHEHVIWLEKIVYYVLNYQQQAGFRVFVLPDQRKYSQQQTQQESMVLNSKYLSSISIHLYSEKPTYSDLIKMFDFLVDPPFDSNQEKMLQQAKNRIQIIKLGNKSFKEPKSSKSPQTPNTSKPLSPRANSRLKSGGGSIQNMTSSKNDSIQMNDSTRLHPIRSVQSRESQRSGGISSNGLSNASLKDRLYKQMLLAHIVSTCKHQFMRTSNHCQFRRVVETLAQVVDNQIPLQYNIGHIASFISKIYTQDIIFEERQSVEQLIQRIVDEMKFSQKSIFGVPINYNSSLINQNLEQNHSIMGVDESYFHRKANLKLANTLQTLDKIYNFQDINDEVVFLRNTFCRIPRKISNKQLTNPNFAYVYGIEEQAHNCAVQMTEQLIEWINTYANKDEMLGEQIKQKDRFNWNNLLQRLRILVGSNFARNELRKQVHSFAVKLKNIHQFLLYLNPSLSSFSINPALLTDLKAFLATFIINYFESNDIKDAFHYYPTFEFTKSSNENQLNISEGLILTNLTFRDFKFNSDYRSADSLNGQINGQIRAPIIVYKAKKQSYSKKQEDQTMLDINIKSRGYTQNTICTTFVSCTAVFQEWYLRNPTLLTQ